MSNIKELLAQISNYARLQVALVAKIEELENRVYSLEEHKKMRDESIKNLQNDVHSLKLNKVTGADLVI